MTGRRRLFRLGRSVEREVDDELRFHLESRARQLVEQGSSLEEAERRALADYGDLDASRRELTAVDERRRRRQRLSTLLESLAHDLRFAVRSLRRAPAFTATAGITLAVGIGACVAIFAVVNGVLLRPLPYGNPDRLVGAWFDMPPIGLRHTQQSASTYFTYARLARTIDAIGLYDDNSVNVAEPGGRGEPERVSCAFVTASLLQLLEVAPIEGRLFTAEEDRPGGPPAVIISEGTWRARFASDPGVLGRSLEVNGVTRRIVGVMPERFRFPSAATQLWIPLALDPVALDGRAFSHTAVARLEPGVSAAAAQRELTALLPRVAELYPKFVSGITTKQIMNQAKPVPVVVPLRDDVTGAIAPTLWMIAAAAALVLLVACANVSNLALVRADARGRELAVREALGAARLRLALQFFAESGALAAVATAAGIAGAVGVVRWLLAAGPSKLPRLDDIAIDGRVVIFAVVAGAFAALVCGGIPALHFARQSTTSVGSSRGGTAQREQQRLRAGLVVGQIALALVAVASSALLLRSFAQLRAIRPGFDANGVSTFWIAPPRTRYAGDTSFTRFYAELVDGAQRLPGVTSAGVVSRLPIENFGIDPNPLYQEDDASYTTKLPPLVLQTSIGGDYLKVMRIPIVSGHGFASAAVQGSDEALVSRGAAALFWKDSTGRSVVGKRFRPLPNERLYTIVGVVEDVRDTMLASPPSPTVYFPEVASTDSLGKPSKRTMALVLRSSRGASADLLPAVQRLVRNLDPSLPIFAVKSMPDVVSSSMAQLTFTIAVLGAAAAVTLLLGVVGLYGVLAYLVSLRRREIGIRMALGAVPGLVAATTARYGLMLAGIGVAAGAVIFALLARYLASFLYGVSPIDPLALAGAAALLLIVAAFASWIPARRAARVDPAIALRGE